MSSARKKHTVTTPCNHVFHKACLDEWKKRSDTCPLCRQALRSQERTEDTTLAELLRRLRQAQMENGRLLRLNQQLSRDNARLTELHERMGETS
jgi:hypothetical protein